MTREERKQRLITSFNQQSLTQKTKERFEHLASQIAYFYQFTDCITDYEESDNSINFYLYYPDNLKIVLTFFDEDNDNLLFTIIKNKKMIASGEETIQHLSENIDYYISNV